ncbi:MAG TPA: hypothetical protein ENK66_11065 [Arcobacter sp.]|nr:hypothetical protein [Arcobacter sp.]
MQRFFFSIIILSFFLSAKNIEIKTFEFYDTNDSNITINTIQNKKNDFKPLTHKKQLIEQSRTYWIKIKLNEKLPTGMYLLKYEGFYFNNTSLKPQQKLKKYRSTKGMIIDFYHDHRRDDITLYFKVLNSIPYKQPKVMLYKYDEYYKNNILSPDSKNYFLLFGIIVGLLIMVIIYNTTVYYFVQESYFLYYSLLQLSLIFIMIYDLGFLTLNVPLFHTVSLIGSFFATLFMRSFLNTKIYLPHIDKVLLFYLFLIFLDLIHVLINQYSLVSHFNLHSIFGAIYFIVGFLRLQQNFTPAKFFLIGWSFLVVSIFITGYIGTPFGFNFFLLGPPLEAIFLGIALAYKLKKSLNEKKEQQELLIHQSKLAAMGKMIGNIAHQWRQPLTSLSYSFMTLREAQKQNRLDGHYLNKKLDKANSQLEFMSQTIDNFKDFYLPNKEKHLFSIEEASRETLEIMEYQFQQYHIEVIVNVEQDIQLLSYKNEYKQVLLNLRSNAKDIFIERKISSPQIIITINHNVISV